jgi:hypothetical protein
MSFNIENGGNITSSSTQAFIKIPIINRSITSASNSGQFILDSSDNNLYYSVGSKWKSITSGIGSVSSVTNTDGSLTIGPTSGSVISSLNLGNINRWTVEQIFPFIQLGLGSPNGNSIIAGISLIDAQKLSIVANDANSSNLGDEIQISPNNTAECGILMLSQSLISEISFFTNNNVTFQIGNSVESNPNYVNTLNNILDDGSGNVNFSGFLRTGGGGSPPTNLAVTSSPFTFNNTLDNNIDVYIGNGTISEIDLNGIALVVGLAPSLTTLHLKPNDYITVIYSSLPTINYLNS